MWYEYEYEYEYVASRTASTVLIVTLGKSETYKETIKEKSTILPYSIHKRIHVRPLRNSIQRVQYSYPSRTGSAWMMRAGSGGYRTVPYGRGNIKCELDSLHASEAWDEGLEWESYQFGRTVFSKSAGIEHELE